MPETSNHDRGLRSALDLERVVIIGASLGGLSAAQEFRKRGWDGHLVVVDGQAELPPDRPPLSKSVLAGKMSIADAQQPLASKIDELDIELRLGQRIDGFAADDRRMKFENDHELTTDGVVIATGATPNMLPSAPAGGVHVLRTAADAEQLIAAVAETTKRIVVIGAGFVGCEVAATLRTMQHEVVLIEATGVPLQRTMPREIGALVADIHSDHGVDVRLDTTVDEFVTHGSTSNETVSAVRLSNGEMIETDVVVVGVGVSPDVEWLEHSGVPIDNGIVCDDLLRCADGIVACGDVANWHNPTFAARMRVEHWDLAQAAGAYAARSLLAFADDEAIEPFAPVPWFWSDQYDMKIQMCGQADPTDELVLLEGSFEERKFAVGFRSGDTCRGVLAMGRPRAVVLAKLKMETSLDWEHVTNT